ncbi:MAG: PH domain-containing protein [Geminicoccaceae bacterium]
MTLNSQRMAMFKRKTPKERTEKGSKNLGAIYAQKTLQPAEEVIYISRFHWIYTLRAIGPLLGAIAVVAIGWALGVIGPFLLVLALPVLFALAHALNKLAYKWVNRVVITNKRLIVQKGWTSRNTMDIGLDRILGHKIEEDAWGRALGYGKFVLVGAGVGEIELPPYMANTTRFRTALTGAKDAVSETKEDKPEAKQPKMRSLVRAAFARR